MVLVEVFEFVEDENGGFHGLGDGESDGAVGLVGGAERAVLVGGGFYDVVGEDDHGDADS